LFAIINNDEEIPLQLSTLYYFCIKYKIMAEITIAIKDWDRLKIKLKRKYNHLTDDDLIFAPGKEDDLINHLQERLHRNREYVVFTLKKGLVNIDNNRL
jgi:hypothetical protein